MMNDITITLDHARNLRYGWGDVKEICRVLTRLEPGDQPRKVTQNRLWQLLAERDPDATALTLYHGLKWEDQRLKADRVEQMLGEFVSDGGDMDTIYDAIVDAMVGAGLVKLPNRGRDNGASGNGARVSGS
jgi:hypothetical protein